MSDFLKQWHTDKNDREESTYENFDYLKIRFKITENQFKNLVVFLTIILNEQVMALAQLSPDYIVEKYTTYLGDPRNIPDTNQHAHGGAHAVLRRDFIDKYYDMWGHCDGWEFMIHAPINTQNLIDDN